MKPLFATILALVAMSAAVPAEEAHPADAARIIAERIDRDEQGVGIATAVVEAGAPHFAAHGVLEAGGTVPVDERTLFEIGSLSKVFTALLLAQMVVEGTMDLERPVADYLPEGMVLPEYQGRQMTLMDLATQSSGLPAIPPELLFADPDNPYRHYDAALFETFLRSYPLQRAPGSQYEYSNTGFALLGMAISHTAGRPYEALVEEIILDPLGMTDTMLVVPDELSGRFASGHDAKGEVVPHWDFTEVFAPAGGHRSTAADLAKFVAAASGQVETPLRRAFDTMLASTRPTGSEGMRIGLALMVLEAPGGAIVWHNGRTGGANAFIGFTEDGSRGVVVLGAMTTTGNEDIGYHLLDPEMPLTPQPEPGG